MSATQSNNNGVKMPPNNGMANSAFPIIRTLTRRRWQLLACLLLVCAVAFSATAMRKQKYEAIARVEIVMDQPSISGLGGIPSRQNSNYFSTQCQLLQSRHVLSVAAKKLNMSGGQWTTDDKGIQDLKDNIKIKPVPGSRLIDIVGISEVAPMAAAIANQVTVAFIETSTAARLASAKRLIGRVNNQIQLYDLEIQEKKTVLNQFRQDHLITGNATSLPTVEARINTIEQQLTASQMKRIDLETQRLQVERSLAFGQGMGELEESLKSILALPQITRIKDALARLRGDEAQFDQIYLSGHPKLKEVRLRIADLQTQLLDQKQTSMRGMIEEITIDYVATIKQEESLLTLLTQQKELGVELTKKQLQFTELLDDLKTHQKFREQCVNRVREFELQEGVAESPVVVIDAAQVPTRPGGLSRTHQAASILLIGIIFSLAFVLSLDKLSHPAQTPQATPYPNMTPYAMPPNWPAAYWPATNQTAPQPVAQNETIQMVYPTETPTMGKVQSIELGKNNHNGLVFKARCRIVHADQSSPEAASFRAISNQLIQRFGQSHQGLVVTSAKESEGKTTCATNLALGLAKSGRKVLLVDANPKNPTLHKVFSGQDGQSSFQDVLSNRDLLENATHDSEVPGLTILTGNDTLQNVNAKTIESFLQHMKEQFDWVIFDASTTNDPLTRELLNSVGKCLLVTSQTDLRAQKDSIRTIEKNGSVCIGCIENTHLSQPQKQQQEVMS